MRDVIIECVCGADLKIVQPDRLRCPKCKRSFVYGSDAQGNDVLNEEIV